METLTSSLDIWQSAVLHSVSFQLGSWKSFGFWKSWIHAEEKYFIVSAVLLQIEYRYLLFSHKTLDMKE